MFYEDPYDGINNNLHLKNLIQYRGNEDEIREKIADRVKDLMKSAKCSQVALANILDISAKTMERRLNAEKDFCIAELYEISQLFDVSLDYICYGKPSLPCSGELAELLSDRSPAEIATATRILKALFNDDNSGTDWR